MTRKNKLLLNSVIGIISQIVTIICGLILAAAILSAYGSDANGLTNSIGQFLGFISLCDLGVGAVVMSSLYKPLAEGNDILLSSIIKSSRNFFRLVGIILLVYVAVLCVVYPSLTQQYDRWFVIMMIVAISINSFSNYFIGVHNALLVQADQKMYIPLGLQAIAVIINTIVCLIMIKMGVSLLVVKFSTAAIYLIRPVFMQLYVNRYYNIDKRVTYDQEPIKQKWNGLAQHFASVIVDRTDVVVLTVFSTLSNVSIYTVYYMVVSSLRSLINSSLSGVQSAMGNMLSKDEVGTLKSFFDKTEWVLHSIVVLVFSVTVILIVPFITVYTKNVHDANYNVPLFAVLLVLANAGFSITLIYKTIVKAAGHYRETQCSAIIEALINVVSSVVLVFKFGLIGVALGTIIAMLYRLVYHIWYIKHNILYRPYKYLLKQIFVDCLCVTVVMFISKFIKLNCSNYFEWVVDAFLVFILAALICLVINYIFYRSYTLSLLKKVFRDKIL